MPRLPQLFSSPRTEHLKKRCTTWIGLGVAVAISRGATLTAAPLDRCLDCLIQRSGSSLATEYNITHQYFLLTAFILAQKGDDVRHVCEVSAAVNLLYGKRH